MLWEQTHMAIQLMFNYSIQTGTAPMGWLGESPCSTRSFENVLFSLGCCGSAPLNTPEQQWQLPQHHWHITGIGGEDIRGGWREGKEKVLLNIPCYPWGQVCILSCNKHLPLLPQLPFWTRATMNLRWRAKKPVKRQGSRLGHYKGNCF